MLFGVSSSEFEYGEGIPVRFTCEGEDVSIPLNWENPPDGTESFVLIMEDPDAPGNTFVHWVLYDIPQKKLSFNEGESSGISGKNSWGNTGYGGPCPPKGHGRHRYFFKVYALDTATIDLDESRNADTVKAAMRGNIIAIAEYMGTFERK